MMLMPSEHNSENKATVLIFLVDRYTSLDSIFPILECIMAVIYFKTLNISKPDLNYEF